MLSRSKARIPFATVQSPEQAEIVKSILSSTLDRRSVVAVRILFARLHVLDKGTSENIKYSDRYKFINGARRVGVGYNMPLEIFGHTSNHSD